MRATSQNLRIRTVLVALFTTGMTGWQKRNGVFRYIGEGRPWNVRIATTTDELKAAWADRGNFDGLLVSAPNLDADLCGFAGTDIPTVLFNLNLPKSSPLFARKTGVVFLHHDSASIGAVAAQHLLSTGVLRSFVFLAPGESAPWADQREDSFAAALSKCDFALTRLTTAQDAVASVSTLRALPKPIGLFAASDKIALHAVSLGRAARLRMPDELAVLGVDNDESICESTTPTLSSVATTPETLGYEAARQLDQLMQRANRPTRDITIGCKPSVFVRESTPGGTPYGPLVEKALAYIESHATDGIGPNDVAKHLGISRRLLDLRFAQVQKRSVLSIIQDRRLACVQRELLAATSTIQELSLKCGYGSPNHLKKIFKERFGVSMRDWQGQRPDKGGSY